MNIRYTLKIEGLIISYSKMNQNMSHDEIECQY